MERTGEVDLAVQVGLFDVGCEVINIGQLVGILQSQLIQFPEVPTRALCQVRLGLEVHRGAPRLLGLLSRTFRLRSRNAISINSNTSNI